MSTLETMGFGFLFIFVCNFSLLALSNFEALGVLRPQEIDMWFVEHLKQSKDLNYIKIGENLYLSYFWKNRVFEKIAKLSGVPNSFHQTGGGFHFLQQDWTIVVCRTNSQTCARCSRRCLAWLRWREWAGTGREGSSLRSRTDWLPSVWQTTRPP